MWLQRRHPALLLSILVCEILVLTHGATSRDRDNLSNPRIVEQPEDGYVAKNEPATLNCKAEGVPKPTITWYRNGQAVITATENPSSHRMLLPEGGLFFLRVIHNKNNKPDVGSYYCNATNIHGTAISRNATLQIAILRDEFRETPLDTRVAVGDTATLHCKPPRGEPEPHTIWRKGGAVINDQTDHRIQVTEEGDLIISNAQKMDMGEYTCLAINKGGEKESPPAMLNVLEKPSFRKTPYDVIIDEGKTIEFECNVAGDPPLKVEWRKEDGHIRYGRARMLSDYTLRIENVEIGDEGLYVCVAQNEVGTTEAVARLTVQSHPSFIIEPTDQVVGIGRTVTLQCVVTGNPPPTVFWSKGTQQNLMFPNQEHGRFSVAEDGTFRIESVQDDDAGEYVCQALNVVGSASTSAHIDVRAEVEIDLPEHDPRPPPIIKIGPQNQTLPVKSYAMLPCQATGQPMPNIRWYKDERSLSLTDPRFMLLDSGTLQISDLKLQDTGSFTCKAVSETGETTWSAFLVVEVSKNKPSSNNFHRTPEFSAFPGSPSQPVITDVTDTTVHLSWQPNSHNGHSLVTSYIVEYFSHQTTDGWVVASNLVERESFTVENLRPDTTYVFLVRAKNNHGIGMPSPLSDPVRSKRARFGSVPSRNVPIEEIRRKLHGDVVRLVQVDPLNSSSIRVSWKLTKTGGAARDIIDGFELVYKPIMDIQSKSILYGATSNQKVGFVYDFVLTGLQSYSWYEICVSAYSSDFTSQCSNPMKKETGESVPSGAPQNVVIHKESDTRIHVTWSPPRRHLRNGVIQGYNIKCISNDNKHNCSRAVNGSTHTLGVDGLEAGMSYTLQLAATTRKGVGTWSQTFIVGPEQPNIMREAWFIGMLIGTIGGTLWLALCIFSIWLCRKRRNRKKMMQNGMFINVPNRKEDTIRNGNMFCRDVYGHKESGYQGTNSMTGMPPEMSSLLEGHKDMEMQDQNIYNTAGHLPPLKTFYQKPNPVTPYATTTLMNAQANNINRPIPGMEHMFRPINPGQVPQQGMSGSGDSCCKPDMGSSDSNTDNSRPNTGSHNQQTMYDTPWVFMPYLGVPHEHSDNMQSPTSDSGSHTTDENGLLIKRGRKSSQKIIPPKQPMINWSELLPPPPEHPPPSDIGTPPDSPGNTMQYGDNRMNRNIVNRSPLSPVSKISACSCPVPHSQTPVSGWNVPVYSDTDHYHRCQSPKFYDGRPYSPKHFICERRTQSPQVGGTWGQRTIACTQPSKVVGVDCGAYPNRSYHSDQEPGIAPSLQQYKIMQGPHGSHYVQGCDYNRFCSDTERGPTPPVRHCMGPHEGQCHCMNRGFMQPHPEESCIDRACQSSLPSLASEYGHLPAYHVRSEPNPHGPHLINDHPGYMRNAESPVSEGPDYAGESDLEPNNNCHQPGDRNSNASGSMMATWASVTDQSNTDCSSVRSSATGSSDGSFLTEADFASAVAKAAELSGLTVVGTTVSDPNPKPAKKQRRPRRAPRPNSPYSTDSNFSAVAHKPYPKSQRKKQLIEQGKWQGRKNDQPDVYPPQIPPDVADLPVYNKPNFPTLTSPTSPTGTAHSSVSGRYKFRGAPLSDVRSESETGFTGNGDIDFRNDATNKV